MKPQDLMNDTIDQLKTEAQNYERRFEQRFKRLKEKLPDPTRLWDNTKETVGEVVRDRRTLYVAGGLAAGLALIAIIGRARRNRALEADPDSLKPRLYVQEREPSLLYKLAMMAIQTFVLTYARRTLEEILERSTKNGAPARSRRAVPPPVPTKKEEESGE